MRTLSVTALLLAALSGPVCAQGVPTEFPADAQPISADLLKSHVLGKKFVGKRADGRILMMEFGADSSYRISSPGGATGGEGAAGALDGKVRLDGNKLCQDMRKTLESSCNDVRVKDNTLFYKRVSNGEVVTYVAQ